MNSWIDTIRNGGNVKRFHTQLLIKEQDVAQHSFNCALLAEHFGRMIVDVDPTKVMLHMLIHDIPETGIGDVPYAVKRENPDLYRELNVAEDKWCKSNTSDYIYDNMVMKGFTYNEIQLCAFVDQFEALLKSIEELSLGNKSVEWIAKKMFDVCISAVRNNTDFMPLLKSVLELGEEINNGN